MIAQYYRDEKIIRVFEHEYSPISLSIPIPALSNIKEIRKAFGFPPFKYWKRTEWGYEIKFTVEMVEE